MVHGKREFLEDLVVLAADETDFAFLVNPVHERPLVLLIYICLKLGDSHFLELFLLSDIFDMDKLFKGLVKNQVASHWQGVSFAAVDLTVQGNLAVEVVDDGLLEVGGFEGGVLGEYACRAEEVVAQFARFHCEQVLQSAIKLAAGRAYKRFELLLDGADLGGMFYFAHGNAELLTDKVNLFLKPDLTVLVPDILRKLRHDSIRRCLQIFKKVMEHLHTLQLLVRTVTRLRQYHLQLAYQKTVLQLEVYLYVVGCC